MCVSIKDFSFEKLTDKSQNKSQKTLQLICKNKSMLVFDKYKGTKTEYVTLAIFDLPTPSKIFYFLELVLVTV